MRTVAIADQTDPATRDADVEIRDGGAALDRGAPLVGCTLGGRYRVVRRIGAGGMGVVYEALNTWTSRRVAVKCLARAADDGVLRTLPQDQVERFLREARATAQVRHPNVVDVLDMGRDAETGTLYIVYELLDGESFRALLDRRSKLGVDEAARLLLPLMGALVQCHQGGVVHRDIKPENLFLARDGACEVPKVIDFGIARTDEAFAGGENLTRTGTALGTPRYMAPEQARGARDVDARADVWAVGVVWFEVLAGRPPYEGEGYNDVLARVLTQDPPALRSVAPGVSVRLARAIDGALVRDPMRRHASMAAFLGAVTRALDASVVEWPGRTRWVAGSMLVLTVAVGVAARWPRHDRPSAPARSALTHEGVASVVARSEPPAVALAAVPAHDHGAPPTEATAPSVRRLPVAQRASAQPMVARLTSRAAGARTGGHAPSTAPATVASAVANGAVLLEP